MIEEVDGTRLGTVVNVIAGDGILCIHPCAKSMTRVMKEMITTHFRASITKSILVSGCRYNCRISYCQITFVRMKLHPKHLNYGALLRLRDTMTEFSFS